MSPSLLFPVSPDEEPSPPSSDCSSPSSEGCSCGSSVCSGASGSSIGTHLPVSGSFSNPASEHTTGRGEYRPAPLPKDLPLSPEPFERALQGTPPLPSGEVIQELSEPAPPQTGEIAPQVAPPTTDEGAQTPAPPATPQVGEIAPQVTSPIADDEKTDQTPPEPLPPCPEGQELDEETGICVPVESPTAEQPQEAAEEPEEQRSDEEQQPEPEEDQPSEDSNSGVIR